MTITGPAPPALPVADATVRKEHVRDDKPIDAQTARPLFCVLRAVAQHVLPLALAGVFVLVFLTFVPDRFEPEEFVNYERLVDGTLSDAQEQTATMVKELNSYLISLTTLIFAGFGWYVSHYRPALQPPVIRTVFFSAVAFMSLATWYAFLTYAQFASELAQNALALVPGQSRILYYLELEASACACGSLLMLLVFAEAVTRKRSTQ